MKGIVKVMLVIAMVLSMGNLCFAAQTYPITVTAYIPTVAQALSVTMTRIDSLGTAAPEDDQWDPWPSTAVDFGTLDSSYGYFGTPYYYAVDVGVTDNSGTVWTLTHTRTSMQRDATNNLNNNVNVTFMKQTSSASTTTQLSKVSYQNSNNVAYNKTTLAGAWLRIYYGIATGSGDATGVTVIPIDKPAGTYTGTATITLAP